MLFADDKVFLLARVFSNRRHAEQFLQGALYANRLSKFKCMEEDLARGDEFEGGAMTDPSGVSMMIQRLDLRAGGVHKVTLEGQHLSSSIKMKLPYFDHLNLYCMYGVRLNGLEMTPENTAAIKERVSFSEKFLDFGNHVVVITNVTKFLNRVVIAANRKKYGLGFDFVTYYDPDIGTTLSPQSIETIFAKRNKFAWQEEFRLVFNTFTQGNDAVVLDIGRIDDIAFLGNTSDMISPAIAIVKDGEGPPSPNCGMRT